MPRPRRPCGRVGAIVDVTHGSVLTNCGYRCHGVAFVPVSGRGHEDAASLVHESKAVQLVGVPEDLEVPGHKFLPQC